MPELHISSDAMNGTVGRSPVRLQCLDRVGRYERRPEAMTFWIVVLLALFLPASAYAQGAAPPTQFCATYNSDSQPEDCSFTSMAMCREAISGVGGWCAPQPLAPAMPAPPLFQFPGQSAPISVPPPPLANQPAPVPPPPMTLPDAPGNPY
jgi:Protein of unknown function (DUF3551)